MSHPLKSLIKKVGVVGAQGVPSSSNINGCDSFFVAKNPAKTPAIPFQCRTCNASLTYAGLCPYCSPPTVPPTPYTGPEWIGRSHIARLARPVR